MTIIYKEVKQRILEMAMNSSPHSKLPSRKNLCQQLLISKTTVDRAIRELIDEGILYSMNGSGTYISDSSTNGIQLTESRCNIAVLLPDIMRDTYPGILRGIEDVMHRRGANVVLCNTDDDLEKEGSYIQRLSRSIINGIIMVPACYKEETDDSELKKMLLEMDVPVVFCNRGIAGLKRPLVTCNNYYGGFLATNHLIHCGYKRIAFLASKPYQITYERYQGYQAALWYHGIEVEDELVHFDEGETSVETGFYAIQKLMHKTDVDAAFCFNDRVACGVINYLSANAIRCGDDFGVIGYDNTPLCEVINPSLTSVSFEEYGNGRKAAEILLEQIAGRQIVAEKMITTMPRLYERGSTRKISNL